MSKELPLVSILIVTYNASAFIEKTLRSCLDQTYSNYEILVLDNASTDSTVACVNRIKKQFTSKSVALYEGKTNLGPYSGLNYLLDRAKGSYIAIQDHDDIWLPKKLERQVEFLENNLDYIGCGTATQYYFEAKSVLICSSKPGDTDFVDHTSLLFRNTDARYDENHSLADVHFEKRVLRKIGKLYCLPEPLTIHRIRQDRNNLSSRRFKLSAKQLAEYRDLHGKTNIIDFLAFTIVSRLPDSVVWWIRRHITLRSAQWTSLEQFKRKYRVAL